MIATSPTARRSSWLSRSTHASPRTTATRVSGASSAMRSDQGGSMVERSRKAPRARGPSRRPAIESMAATLDDRLRIGESQLWIVSPRRDCMLLMTDPHPILVLGATGKTGRRVADRLAALGRDVRRGSRGGAPPFDWEDPPTWGPALEGTRQAYISFYPDLAVPGAAAAVGALGEEAARRGVEHLVLLSGRGEEEAQRAEALLRDAHPLVTVVRSSWFAQNFSESFLLDGVLAGTVALPVGDVGEPFVDVDDLADVAVAALTHAGHAGNTYEITGPRLLTFAETVAEVARASGREVAFVSVAPADYATELAAADLPPGVADLIMYLFGEVLDGRNAHLADGVQRALGRPPRDFADYARNAAATGVWHA